MKKNMIESKIEKYLNTWIKIMIEQMNAKFTSLLIVSSITMLLLVSMTLPLITSVYEVEGNSSMEELSSQSGFGGYSSENSSSQYAEYEVVVDAPSQREGNYGETLTYTFEILNNGTQMDSYDWTAESGRGWLISDDEGSITDLSPNGTAEVLLTIQIPEDAEPYTADRLILEVTSRTDSSVTDTGVTYTYTDARYGCKIEPMVENIERTPGSEFTITYELKNVGNIMDSYELMPYVDNPYWEVSSKDTTELLEPSEAITVDVDVLMPEVGMEYKLEEKDIYRGATKNIVLNAQAGNGIINTTSPTPSVTVGPYYSATLRPIEPFKTIEYAETTTDIDFDLEVRNLCNVRDEEDSKMDISVSEKNKSFETRVDLDEEGEAERWAASISAPNVTLVGGETDEIRTRVTAPRKPFNGTFTAEFVARPFPHSDVSDQYIHNGTGEVKVVVNQSGGVEVSPVEENVDGRPEETVRLDFTVKNTGNGIDHYELHSSTQNGWESDIVKVEGENKSLVENLHPSREANVTVEVKIPRKVELGHTEEVILSATSLFERNQRDETVSDQGSAFIEVGEGYSVILEPDMNKTTVYPEETVSYQIEVTNAGNVRDTITLSLEHSETERWDAELVDASLTIDRWNTTTTHLNVTPSSDAVHEKPFNVTVIGRSSGNRSKTDTANTTTEVVKVPDVKIEAVDPELSIRPGETANMSIKIHNNGNTNDSFELEAGSENDAWNIYVQEELVELAPLTSEIRNVTVTAPEIPDVPSYESLEELDILGGTQFEVMINATSRTDSSVNESIKEELTVEKVKRHRITSFEAQNALPGESAEHQIEVFNLGNAEDKVDLNLTSEEDEAYLGNAHLDEDVLELGIGEKAVTNLTVELPLSLEPCLGEKIEVTVGDEYFSEETTTTTRVVMIDAEEPSKTIKIGETAGYDITIMNVPLEEEDKNAGESLPDVVNLSAPVERLESQGWEITFQHRGSEFDVNSDTLEFEEAYESEELILEMDAPRVEREDVQEFEIVANSRSKSLPAETNVLVTRTKMSWFDIRPVDISIDPRKNGRELEITFSIERSGSEDLLPDEESPVPAIPFELVIDDHTISEEEIEFLGREGTGVSEEVFRYKLVHKTDDWKWGETVRRHDVEVIVDPDDEIYMINAAGDAENNNEMSRDMMISRYHGIPYWLPLILFVVSLLAFIISWRALREHNGLCVSMGLSLGVLFASMVMFPWYWTIGSSELINRINMGIIILGMISFAALLYMIRFEIKDLLSSVTRHIIKEKSSKPEKDLNPRAEKDESEKREREEGGWLTEERSVEKEPEKEETPSPYYYHLALSLTGGITYLVFLLMTNLDLIFMGDYVGALTTGFFEISNFVYIPSLIFVGVYVFIGLVIAIWTAKLHEELWMRISGNEKVIEDLRVKVQQFTKDGEKSVSE